MSIHPPVQAEGPGAIVEPSVRAVIAGNGLPQVVATIGAHRLVRLLRLVSVAREIPINGGRCDRVAPYRPDGRQPDAELPARVMRRPVNRARRDLGLKDWRDRLRFAWKPTFQPGELPRGQFRPVDPSPPDTA